MSDRAPGEMTMREAGSLGGKARRDAGTDYAALGKKGGDTTKARYGHEHYLRMGQLGGAVNAAKGKEHFQRIGALGGARVKALVARGKAAEEQQP